MTFPGLFSGVVWVLMLSSELPGLCFVAVTLLLLGEFLAIITSKIFSFPFSLSAATDILIRCVLHYSFPSQPSTSPPNCGVSSWFSLELALCWLWLISFFPLGEIKKDGTGQSPFPSNRRLDVILLWKEFFPMENRLLWQRHFGKGFQNKLVIPRHQQHNSLVYHLLLSLHFGGRRRR